MHFGGMKLQSLSHCLKSPTDSVFNYLDLEINRFNASIKTNRTTSTIDYLKLKWIWMSYKNK